ncbi:hypothetical protein HYH02_007419 [Chlamydomonas schloesseri]|uniref:Pherophorin domain-containing protein n=1 Tax=Chlamydomonas schloesseri TaxID=2026947 RepID=A0A835WH87_9CHLO|nr:hypothetical protein HYH02_007419 [Chlamydomonas schloesseri]|eukprot:KAG2447493.1 hypothetical protein HYH02_007419 [Chlamydomonas schloesseri]
MRSSYSLIAVLVAAACAAAQGAQSGLYTSFPFCKCKKTPSAYKLGDIVTAKGNGQYCFKLSAKVPAGCNDYCCNKADLKKIEFNVNKSCDVFGDVVKATINGQPTKVGASFNEPIDGPVGSTTLVLTQLGLGLGSDGAEICITLSKNKNGKGCTTLEELCVPPAGLPKGVCSAALFDSQNDCCPISTPGIPSPPPPSPPPPPPPPPPPSPPPPSPPPPCKVCYTISISGKPTPEPVPPFRYTPSDCDDVATIITDAMSAAISAKDVKVINEFALDQCTGEVVTVCATFFSNEEARKLQPDADAVLNTLFDIAVDECGAATYGYTQMAAVGGADGGFDCLPPPPSPPPPSPPPPSPPPPSPPPPCEACVYLSLLQTGIVAFPYEFSPTVCSAYAELILGQIEAEASDLKVTVNFSPVVCASDVIKLCATFFSSEEGAKLQTFIDNYLPSWLDLITGPQGCPAYLYGYTPIATVGGSGGTATDPSASCLSGYSRTSSSCQPEKVDFPKCACNTKPGATPFAFKPLMFTMAGRTKDTTAYCFNITTVTPTSPTSPCGSSSSLLKAEFYADDTKRRKVTGMYVRPNGGPSKWLAATWGAVGEQTLKATPLNWSMGQANGGVICMELTKDTDIQDFCLPSTSSTCWGNLFDDTKDW